MADRAGVAVLVGVLLAVTGTGCSTTADAEQASGSGWTRLPDTPLGPRDDAVLVGLGDRVLVVGGWEFSCPPNADCSAPDEPLFDDGAVYDATTGSWSAVAPPPFGLRRADGATAALDGTAYLVTGCADGPACEAPPRLLSYRPDDDRWTDHGPVPGPHPVPYPVPRRVTALADNLLVRPTDDTRGEFPDLLFDPAGSTWTEVPDDPLPLTYGRVVVPVDGQLVLTGLPSAVLPPGTGPADLATRFDRTLAARFDLARDEWTVLPDAPGKGDQLLPTDRGLLLNGLDSGASGWMLDTGTWTWSALPAHDQQYDDIHGVLGRDRAVYDVHTVSTMPQPVVYDSVRGGYVTIPPPPGRGDVYGDSSTALGRDLFVIGGRRSGSGAPADGGEAWVWRAPPG